MDKKKIALDFLTGKISANDLRRAAGFPDWNPIAFICEPLDKSGGEPQDGDICTFQTDADIGPHFFEGMSYAAYVEACRQNPNADNEPTTVIFWAPNVTQ